MESKEQGASRQTGVPAITRRVPDAVTRAASRLPREAVGARSLEAFKARMDGAWSNPREPGSREGEPVPGPDYEEDEEEYEEAPPVHQYIVDDLIRVEPVVKPKPAKRGGEKNAGKSRRKKNKGKNKKKGTPCEMEYKNFCIHGECIYLEHLQMVTCKCHQDFFGERCGEQFMKTQRKNDVADYSKTVLVVVAVLLSSVSFITVLIIVIVQVRKKCPQYEEKEERKKLRQENRNGHVGV
ncbi:PREDICTED: amphiregulin [Corvus brachyrhynchos]|uniref:amphiregulin n=1 Tax=Corvus brachyrhynchos TaxID=85066 RepID=UPI0004DDEFA8|nr:PREDICTED: amphiregulin [Corvus brachyrhynchos]